MSDLLRTFEFLRGTALHCPLLLIYRTVSYQIPDRQVFGLDGQRHGMVYTHSGTIPKQTNCRQSRLAATLRRAAFLPVGIANFKYHEYV